MDIYSLKSCFIFDPTLKPSKNISKPTDIQKQEAKLILYFPSSEETLIKQSNAGIIEGSLDMISKFSNSNNKLLWTQLTGFYYVAYKIEKNYYLCLILERNNNKRGFNIYSNTKSKRKFLISLLKNFYYNFYMFHGTFHENFFKNNVDIRENEKDYTNLIYRFSDFISSYFDSLNEINVPFFEGILYANLNENYYEIIFNCLSVFEKNKNIQKISLIYKGFLIHNEIDINTMSLLYNIYYYNVNGKDKLNNFLVPLLNNENNNDNNNLIFSPFNKCFEKAKNEKKVFLFCLNDENNNEIFIPNVKIYSLNEEYKLCILFYEELMIFLFMNKDYDYFNNKKENFNDLKDFIEMKFSNLIQNYLKNNINFEKKIHNFNNNNENNKNNKENINYFYYNIDNKALKLSGFFYNGNKIDKNKMELIYNIYDLISNKEIKNCAIKINEKLYFYYISNFNQKIVIIIKNNLPLEEVKEKYLNKVLNLIEYT